MALRDIFSLPAFCSSICTQFSGIRAQLRYQCRECWKLKVIQRAARSSQARGCWKYLVAAAMKAGRAQTSPSPLTGSGNTVKANNGLLPSSRHNKVNSPYRDGASAHVQEISVWIISWIRNSVHMLLYMQQLYTVAATNSLLIIFYFFA